MTSLPSFCSYIFHHSNQMLHEFQRVAAGDSKSICFTIAGEGNDEICDLVYVEMNKNR